MFAFVIWALCGLGFIGVGLHGVRSNKPVRFWANIKDAPNTENVKGYNKAVAKLWCAFGGGMIVLGLPLLAGQNSPLVLISIFGCFFLCIALMIIYTAIENKYRKK